MDSTLHGNCIPCPSCELRREALTGLSGEFGPITDHRHVHVPCNDCGGQGLRPLTAQQVVDAAAAEARAKYWPAKEAVWAEQLGNVVVFRRRKRAP